jgi:hypothetical protein
LEVSSHCYHSPVIEQGRPSEKIPVVDLSSSSDEEDLILDTSRDEEFAKRLLSNLNRELLWPPIDGKVFILSDSNEEKEEVREEEAADTIFCCKVLGPN